MSTTNTAITQPRRRTDADLLPERQIPHPPNDHVEERIVIYIRLLRKNLRRLLDEHADDSGSDECDCYKCDDARGVFWFLNFIESLFEGDIVKHWTWMTPEQVKEWANKLEISSPTVEEFVRSCREEMEESLAEVARSGI